MKTLLGIVIVSAILGSVAPQPAFAQGGPTTGMCNTCGTFEDVWGNPLTACNSATSGSWGCADDWPIGNQCFLWDDTCSTSVVSASGAFVEDYACVELRAPEHSWWTYAALPILGNESPATDLGSISFTRWAPFGRDSQFSDAR